MRKGRVDLRRLHEVSGTWRADEANFVDDGLLLVAFSAGVAF